MKGDGNEGDRQHRQGNLFPLTLVGFLVINPPAAAYNSGMKKSIFAIALAVVVGFVSAVALCVQALQAQAVSSFSDGSMRVVVDAGHGGIDGGVSGRNTKVKESDLNLAISMELKDALEDMGFEVTLTRKTEAGLYDTTAKGFKKRDMQKRKEIIQKADPALVVSIHQNFYPAKGTRGGQVFYSAKSEGSLQLARHMQTQLDELYAKEGVKPRKITAGEYFMLSCYPCPSVIVECGFLSNPEDERLLSTQSWRKKIAAAVAAGALAFYAGASA